MNIISLSEVYDSTHQSFTNLHITITYKTQKELIIALNGICYRIHCKKMYVETKNPWLRSDETQSVQY